MKLSGIFVASVLGLVCLLVVGSYIHSAAMKRAAQYNAYVTLKKAYQHLIQYGAVTNPSPTVAQVFPYTNRLSIQGTNYDCVLGLKWAPLSSTDIVMAVTGNGSVIYFDGQEAPQFVDFDRGAGVNP